MGRRVLEVPGSESTVFASARRCSSARDLEPSYERLRDALGLGEPFRDPGVGAFGLHNVVCALGEDFLEIVSPTQEGTAAGRHLDRRGEGGYMLIFQLDDLAGARERARRRSACAPCGASTSTTSPPATCTPPTSAATIVSIDRPLPPESWRWGGPDWIGRAVRGRGPGGSPG